MAGKRRSPLFAENFSRNLDELRRFLEPAASASFERLLDRLFQDIVPNLCRFPRSGRDFLRHRLRSREAVVLSRRLKAALKKGGELREFVVGDYIVLYLVRPASVAFLAIKHHRQLSFDLRLFWS